MASISPTVASPWYYPSPIVAKTILSTTTIAVSVGLIAGNNTFGGTNYAGFTYGLAAALAIPGFMLGVLGASFIHMAIEDKNMDLTSAENGTDILFYIAGITAAVAVNVLYS